MAKFPIEMNDDEGQTDAINYLLSGPSGLGQNFAGFSSFAPAYLTGNYRTPFTQPATITKLGTGTTGSSTLNLSPDTVGLLAGMPVSGDEIPSGTTVVSVGSTSIVLSNNLTGDVEDIDVTFENVANLYVAPISLSTSEFVDTRTLKFTFASAQPLAPFVPGNPINISDVTTDSSNPSDYSFAGTKAVLGSQTTYSGITPTTLTGSGSGLIVNVILESSGAVAYDENNTQIEIDTDGGDYSVGDTLKILGTDLGGTSPANDLTLTVLHVTGAWYDGYYTTIGVLSCTTTECLVRLSSSNSIRPDGTGGTIGLNVMDSDNSTDCNARVTVTGGTDRVFISGQLDQTVSYEVLTGTQELVVTVSVNRYTGFTNSDPVNPDYLFNFDGTVADKVYTFTGLTGTGTLPLIETIFSTLLDQPKPNYYWYILEVNFSGSNIQIADSLFGLRSLSSQVVKQ